MTPEEWAKHVYGNATGPIKVSRYACDDLEMCIADAVRVAVAESEGCFRVALGMKSDETLHDWMIRHQDEVHRLREQAVAEEREACARQADAEEDRCRDEVDKNGPEVDEFLARANGAATIAEAIRARTAG